MARLKVGIDIGSRTIKGVVLKSLSEGSVTLSRYAIVDTPEASIGGTFSDKALLKPKEVVLKLKELVGKLGAKGAEAILVISDQLVVINWLTMPVKAKEAIEASIPSTLAPLLPLELDKWFYDFQLLELAKKQTVVISEAILKQNLFEVGQALIDAGLNPSAIDSSTFNLVNLFHDYLINPQNEKKNICLINLGHSGTTVAFFKEGILKATRFIPIGGSHFTKLIMDGKHVTEEQAEKIKHEEEVFVKDDIDKQNRIEIYNIIKPSFGDLVKGIYNSIDQYLARFREFKIHEIILTGGSASFKNINYALQTHLNTKTIFGNEILKIESASGEMTNEEKNTLSSAIGALMRD